MRIRVNHVNTIMMPCITAIICAILLWSSILFNIAYAQENILKCIIIDGSRVIHLNLETTDQLLANEHLPVWTANSRKRTHSQREGTLTHELKPNFVKNNIGEFIFYHDKEKCAAVVLFRRTERLYGIVGTQYYIVDLPLEKCLEGVHIGDYVNRIDCASTDIEDHAKPLDLSMHRDRGSTVEHSAPFTFADGHSITYLYPELMVFIAYDKVQILKETFPTEYLEIIVKEYIIYFNAVDMLISKLSTDNIKLHINLAGIIIEDHENVFNFLQPYHGSPYYYDVSSTGELFQQYGMQNIQTLSQDSFDFFFISTGKTLWRSDTNQYVSGLSWEIDTYSWKSDYIFDQIWPGAIARHANGYEYITASHELAHLLFIKHDPTDKGYCYGRTQCYAIMQEFDRYCPDCLKWSDESINDLRIYVRQNRNHCYLLNQPRSLHPYGSRIRTLSPSDQCRCYGFEFEPRTLTNRHRNSDIIPHRGCGQKLICDKRNAKAKLPLPIDGTPCGKDKVCWDRICQPISYAP